MAIVDLPWVVQGMWQSLRLWLGLLSGLHVSQKRGFSRSFAPLNPVTVTGFSRSWCLHSSISSHEEITAILETKSQMRSIPLFRAPLISSALMIETWISHRVGPPGASATPSSSIPPTRRRRSGARPSSIARNRWEPRSGATRWATRLGYGMGCRVASMLHPKIFGWPSTWQVGALEHEFYDFPCIGNVMIPTDFHSMIFQRGRSTTNQHGLRTVSPWTKLTKEKVWAHEPSRSCSDFDGWFSNSTLRPSKFIYIILEAMI